jgi:hypothetical protein
MVVVVVVAAAAAVWSSDCVPTHPPATTGQMERLAELLARNDHRFWCKQKRFLGFRFSETENPSARLTPDMVPWARLPTGKRMKKHEDFLLKLLTLRKFKFRVTFADLSEVCLCLFVVVIINTRVVIYSLRWFCGVHESCMGGASAR